jgi:hypothetical protein
LLCEGRKGKEEKVSLCGEGEERGKRKRTNTQVRVDRGVTGGTGQVLVLAVRDVEVGLRVAVLLRETKVDDVDLVPTLADAHEEVVGLDIAVDEVARVNVLDAGDLKREKGVSRDEKGREKRGRTSWSARRRVVFKLNLRLQKLKRSSSEGPSKSRTIAL